MKNKKIILSVTAGLLLVTSLSLGIKNTFVKGEEGIWDEVAIAYTYNLNSEIYIPNINYKVNNVTYVATPTVVFPDGVASSNNSVTMNQVGEYKVIYNAKTPSGVVSKEQKFSVSCGTFTISGNESFASYGHDPLSCDLSEVYNVNAGQESAELDGVYVRLAENEIITFNKYIDVSNVTESDYLFTGYIAPSAIGTFDFEEIDFLLTDADDPSIWVKMATRRRTVVDSKVGFASTRVKANNQVYGAINYTQIYQNAMDIYGSSQIMPFGGYSSYYYQNPDKTYDYHKFETKSNAHPFRFSLDSASMKMYNTVNFFTCTSKGNTLDEYDWTPNLTGKEVHIVTDLDNKEVYGNNLFTGFPSGKVQLSIQCDGYSSKYANFVICSVLGTDITPEFDFKDEEAPELTVDCPYETMPEGKVGGTYPVFPATAYDEYSKYCEVKKEVIYNFNTENAASVAIDGDVVHTNKAGWYALIYSASDNSGNTTTKTYKFHVGGTINNITFADFDNSYKTKNIGEMYEIAPYSVSGGSGKISVNATVRSPKGKIFDYTSAFRLEELGAWTIEYIATDIVGNEKTTSYELFVNPCETVYLGSEPTLPKAIISTGSYLIPEVKALSYDSQGAKTSKTCKVKVVNNDASEYDTIYSGDYLTYLTTEAKTSIRLDYFYGEYSSSTVLKSYNIPVITGYNEDTQEIYLDNYFLGNNFTASHSYKGELLSSNTSGDVSALFANPLQVIDFGMTLGFIKDKATFSSLDLIFEDAQDSSLSVTLNIKLDAYTSTISYKNNSDYINSSVLGGGDLKIALEDGKFYLNNLVSIPVESYDNGEEYTSFPSHEAYLTIRLNDATTSSQVMVKKLNNHDFTTKETADEFIDEISPEMFLFGGYGGHYRINDVYETNAAFAADVICPNVDTTITVKNPNNKSVVNGEDPVDTFDIDLNIYGAYKITYVAKDSLLNSSQKKMTVYASDDAEPVITMEKDMVSECNVNDYIYLPTFTATDDSSSSEEITYTVFVVYPDGKKIALSKDVRYFKPSYAGMYFFRFTAIDKYDNTSYVEYVVNVK